jgi:hypothetical protein
MVNKTDFTTNLPKYKALKVIRLKINMALLIVRKRTLAYISVHQSELVFT